MLERAMLSEAREGAATWTLEELTGPEKRWRHYADSTLERGLCGEPCNGRPVIWPGTPEYEEGLKSLCPDCERIHRERRREGA